MRALAAEVAGVAGDFLQVPRDLEAGQVGNEGSSSHYNTKLRCHNSCSSSRLAQVFPLFSVCCPEVDQLAFGVNSG